jgi:hypothetical protein
VYPEERGFRSFVLVIGKILLMDACCYRSALTNFKFSNAKKNCIVSVFDRVKESTSNLSNKRRCSFKRKVLLAVGESCRSLGISPLPQMPTVHNCSSQTEYEIFSTWCLTCDSGYTDMGSGVGFCRISSPLLSSKLSCETAHCQSLMYEDSKRM